MNRGRLMGLVCCGGRSSRMGMDKGLMINAGIPWAARIARLVEQVGLQYRLSIRADQEAQYALQFPKEQLLQDDPEIRVEGPALALLSAHRQLPDHDLLVLACDLQNLQTEVLHLLMTQYQYHPEAEAIVITHRGAMEPLCAVYTFRGLAQICQLAASGRLASNSLKYLVSVLHTVTIPLPAEHHQQLKNFNSPEDLEQV